MSEALIIRLDRDEARAPTPTEVFPHAPAVTSSIHCELKKVKFSEFFGAPDGATTEAWLENMAMCFALRNYTSNMKVHMVVFQLKGSSSMVEDAPTIAEHGHRRCVMGTVRGMVPREVPFRGIH
jgi:hypothetical protein